MFAHFHFPFRCWHQQVLHDIYITQRRTEQWTELRASIENSGHVEPWNVASSGGEVSDELNVKVGATRRKQFWISKYITMKVTEYLHAWRCRIEIQSEILEEVIGRIGTVVGWRFTRNFEGFRVGDSEWRHECGLSGICHR